MQVVKRKVFSSSLQALVSCRTRDFERKSGTLFVFAFDERSSNYSIEFADFRGGLKGEVWKERGHEYFYFEDGEAPADAGMWAEGEVHEIR